MVLEIADIRILPGKEAQFESAIELGLRTVHTRAKGMRGYRLDRCVETPGRYQLQVRWDSVEDHMEGYRESELATEFRSMIRHLLAEPAEVSHFERVFQGAGWPTGD